MDPTMNTGQLAFNYLQASTLLCGRLTVDLEEAKADAARVRGELEVSKAEVARLRAEIADLKAEVAEKTYRQRLTKDDIARCVAEENNIKGLLDAAIQCAGESEAAIEAALAGHELVEAAPSAGEAPVSLTNWLSPSMSGSSVSLSSD